MIILSQPSVKLRHIYMGHTVDKKNNENKSGRVFCSGIVFVYVICKEVRVKRKNGYV